MKTSKYILAPEGEGQGGGGTATITAPAVDATSHESEASALFSTPATAEVVEDVQKPKETKPAATPEKPKTPPTEEKKPKNILDALKPKDAAAPAEGEKPADETPAPPDPEDLIKLSDKAAPTTVKAFDGMKAITKTLRTELAAARAEVETLKKQPPASAPADPEKEKQYKEALDRLAILDLQSHPDFRRQYGEPKAKLVESITEALKSNGVADVDVTALLGKPRAEFGKAVNEIAAKLGDFDRAQFVADARQLFDVDAKAKAALAQAGDLGKQIQERTQATQRAAFEETWKAFDPAENMMGKHEIPEHTDPENRALLESYNKSVDSLKSEAEKIMFSANSDKGVAQVATKAAMFDHMQKHVIPVVVKEYGALLELNKTLTAELKALKGSKGAAARPGSAAPGSSERKLEDMGHEEAAKVLFAKG